jgi:sugar phosphate isomerase/epimerase
LTARSRLAVSNIAWPSDADETALDVAAESGFTGVELAPAKTFGPWETIDLALIRRRAAALAVRGMPVVALQGILFGMAGAKLFGDEMERAELARHLALVARIAGACGGVPCVFGAPAVRDPGDLPPDAAFEHAAGFFRAIAPRFADEGATLAFEANPAAYGCRFITHTSEAIALVQAVDRPGFTLQLDVGTMLMNDEPPALAGHAAPLAAHCHASAPHLAPVAGLAASHAPIAAALRASGYAGWVSVEMRATPGWKSALQQAGRAMREIWL